MAVAVGASCAFLSPIGHQCNTLVMGPGNYRFFSGFHENELNNKYCQKNQSATISNKWDSIGERTQIESDLLVLTKSTNCTDDKHKPCESASDKRSNPAVPSNPYVCDR